MHHHRHLATPDEPPCPSLPVALLLIGHQVSSCYPQETQDFHKEISKLLEDHYAVLEPSLCRSLVQSLILLRNRGQVRPKQPSLSLLSSSLSSTHRVHSPSCWCPPPSWLWGIRTVNSPLRHPSPCASQVSPIDLLPLFFRLFRCNSKPLRQLLHRHIISGEATAMLPPRPPSRQVPSARAPTLNGAMAAASLQTSRRATSSSATTSSTALSRTSCTPCCRFAHGSGFPCSLAAWH